MFASTCSGIDDHGLGPLSPNWKAIDKDVARLVESGEDYERPQSAPPHFADGMANGFSMGGSGGGALQGSRFAGGDQFNYTDIRYDEDYEKFYQFQAAAGVAGLKLPPPLDTRTLYNDLPQFSGPLNGGLNGGLTNPLDLVPATSYAALDVLAQQQKLQPGGGSAPPLTLNGIASGVPPTVLAAMTQLSLGGGSPGPLGGAGGSGVNLQFQQAMDGLARQQSSGQLPSDTPPPHTPPLHQAGGAAHSQHPNQLAATAALAAAMQVANNSHHQQQQQQQMAPQGVGYGDGRGNGFNMGGPMGGPQPVNGLGMPSGLQGVDAQAAYQAAYQAAMQQQMLAQSMQLQMLSHVPPAGNHVGMGPGPGFMPPPGAGSDLSQVHMVAAMAAQQALNGNGGMVPHAMTAGGYVNPAIAAAAATVMQRPDDCYGGMVGSGRGHNGNGYDDSRDDRHRGRYRDRDRDRDRDRGRRGGGNIEHRGQHSHHGSGRDSRAGGDSGRLGGGSGGVDDDDTFTYRFSHLEEAAGQVLSIAKDQNGCRFLQRKFDEGGAAAVGRVLPEVLEALPELMVDPFGNYLVQKLLDRCDDSQRLQVIERASREGELVNVALNTHGTRAVQKLVETLTTREQVTLVIEALRPGVVNLIRDLNGNHVIQRCLQLGARLGRLSPGDSQFIYDAAADNCLNVATHRHGCCVLQRCLDFASAAQRARLVDCICAHVLLLAQDPFGNYVCQYVLELGDAESSGRVLRGLAGHIPDLAQQKFSSNVVEKCLKLPGLSTNQLKAEREVAIRELISSPNMGRLLQDPYANYVMQSALVVTQGALHNAVVDAIRPFLPQLRSTPNGKRILSKINVKI